MIVFMCMCVCVHMNHGNQKEAAGHCGTWKLNSGYEVWQQTSLPSKPLCQLRDSFFSDLEG